jgi:hypothetical protein
MADHQINICDDWHGNKGDKVTFVNNTSGNCKITQDGKTWPFKEGPPLPTDGSSIPPGGTVTAHLKNDLADGKHPYDVDCCKSQTPKNVTVP